MVLKAHLKICDNELTFSEVVEVVLDSEDDVKASKETIHSSKAIATPIPILKVNQKKASPRYKETNKSPALFRREHTCDIYGKTNHSVKVYWFVNSTCQFSQKKDILKQSACKEKQQEVGQLHYRGADPDCQQHPWT